LRKRKNALTVEHISDNALEIKDTVIDEEVSFEAEVAIGILNKLPVNQQIIINMYMIDGYSHNKIAI